MNEEHLPLLLGKTRSLFYRDEHAEDTLQWAAYAAEHSISRGHRWESFAEAEEFLTEVLASDEFRRRFPRVVDVRLVETREVLLSGATGEPLAISGGGPFDARPLEGGRIDFHVDSMLEVILLHELAHVISPRHTAPIPATAVADDDFDVDPGREVDGHNQWFRATLCWLLEHFALTIEHEELRQAYSDFRLPVPDEADLWEAARRNEFWMLELARLAEIDRMREEEMLAEIQARMDDGGDVLQQGVIPDMSSLLAFGAFFDELREIQEISQERLAQIVSQVEACTRLDVERIETLKDLPAEDRDRRLTVYMAVALGADPRWALTAHGIHRFHDDIEMRDLRTLNPAWVRQVEWMNDALRARPSREHENRPSDLCGPALRMTQKST